MPRLLDVHTTGPILVSMDLHGHLADFERLRDLFLAGGPECVWLGVGDWVHGPDSGGRPQLTDRQGRRLYAYPDESREILRQLFALMDAHPGRVHSLLGNHEHAHIGGPRTQKFHADEAAHLESTMTPAEVLELRRRFRQWPICARLSCGVVVTHGALSGPLARAADLERIRFEGQNDPASHELLRSAMSHYGYADGADTALLEALAEGARVAPRVIVHGHDRDESGYGPTGTRALLVCSSFGASHEGKTYVWLDGTKRYGSLADLRPGIELRRLWASG